MIERWGPRALPILWRTFAILLVGLALVGAMGILAIVFGGV